MSYAYSPDNGATWPELNLTLDQANQGANTYGGTDADRAAKGYYLEVYETTSLCAPSRSATPVLLGIEAIYEAVPLSAADCAAATRQQLSNTITSQVPATMARDPEVAASDQDKADQAETAQIALRDTPDENLGQFDPTLAGYLPSVFAISGRLATQAHAEISADDARAESGSAKALGAADRADLNAWAQLVDEGGIDEPPVKVRQGIRVPLESYGTIVIERATFPADASGTEGFIYTMVYADADLAGAISLRVYDIAGNWLGYSITFEPTNDPAVYTQPTPAGFRTTLPMVRQHEQFAGAAAISGMFPIAVETGRQSSTIRWGGEHVGSASG